MKSDLSNLDVSIMRGLSIYMVLPSMSWIAMLSLMCQIFIGDRIQVYSLIGSTTLSLSFLGMIFQKGGVCNL